MAFKKVLYILCIIFAGSINGQTYLNLSFENKVKGTNQLEKWYLANNMYTIEIDSTEKVDLSNSLKIEVNTIHKNHFGFASNIFPAEYAKGKSIELRGWIKTKNVAKGYAGLWLSAKHDGVTKNFNNMNDSGLKNSNDWTAVSIRLDIDKSVNNISFGAILTGQGTAWIDRLEVLIDGEKFEDIQPSYNKLSKAELSWLKQQVYPLKTFEPGEDDNDLAIFSQLTSGSQVVALGESTHGSSEIFKIKHRIIQYLIEKENFDVFSIEANMPESYKLNKYIVYGDGNPVDLIKGMHYWTWRTQEMLDLIEWMKDYNQSTQKIQFTGFDMQYYHSSISILERAFEENVDVSNLILRLRSLLFNISELKAKSTSNIVSPNDKDNVLLLIKSIKEKTAESNFSEEKLQWLKQNLRLIEQYINTSGNTRDYFMAENLLWIHSQNPVSKIILWGHNNHIKESGNSAGKYLKKHLPSDYISIGFCFYEGSFTAVGEAGLKSYEAQRALIGSYEYFFNQIDEPIFLLDLRQIKKEESYLNSWILEKLNFRQIGSMNSTNQFHKTDLTNDFDMVIFIKRSTESQILD